MKLFEDIPEDKYENAEYIYEYLNNHSVIGNENPDYNGIFHVYWRGIIEDKHVLTVKSILCTQNISKIIFWIEDSNRALLSPKYLHLLQFSKFIEIKIFDKSIIRQINSSEKVKQKICNIFDIALSDKDPRYRADIFRFIVLNVFGGVYVDLDMLLLRDLSHIHLNRWCSKWEDHKRGDGAILKLEKDHDVHEKIIENDPKNQRCFWIYDSMDYKNANLNITSLPAVFFDLNWIALDVTINGIKINNCENFLQKTDQDVNMNNFLKGCFAYHWHNKWNYPNYKDSFAGRLNADMDKIIEEKYNIKPLKIFQE